MCEFNQQEIEKRFNEELENNVKLDLKSISEEKSNFSEEENILQKDDDIDKKMKT